MLTRSAVLGAVLIALPRLGSAQSPESLAPRQVAERIMSVASLVQSDPIWTPDGAHLRFVSSLFAGGLASVPVEGGMPARVTGLIARDVVKQSPNGKELAFVSDQSGNPEIWLAETSGGAERQLTSLGARINALSWSPDGQWIAFSALRYGQYDLWKVRVADGTVYRLSDDPRYEIYPSWTPDGRSIVYTRSDDRWADHDLMIRSADGGEPRVIATDKDLFDYGTIGFRAKVGYPQISPDGKLVLFRSHRSGWIDYWVVAIAGGAPRQLAVESADQSDAVWSPDGREVAYVANRNGAMNLEVVAAAGGTPRVVVPVTMGVVGAPAWSPDGSKLAYTEGTPTRPQDLYVVASSGGAPRQLTVSLDPAIERTMVVPEKVSYSSDQFTINGYLYRPLKVPLGKRAPGIVIAHGGPTSQFSDTYNTQAQFLAQMGYLVLAPNIRGSSGYGKAFEDANNPCWTHCDLRDIVAGAEFLKRQPEVDPEKLGITGNSYGGITTMAAVTRAPLVFQAAAAQSGYANWITFQDYNTDLQHFKLTQYEWGPYPDSAAVYRRNSTIFAVDQVVTPVLLIYGTGDAPSWRPGVLPVPASAEFAHALDRLNKVVKVKTYPNELYYVTGRENSKQVLLDLLEWFDRYLRDGVTKARPTAATGGTR